MGIDYDPFALRFQVDPYPHYAALRAEAPVHWAEASQTWVVSRYDDVLAVLKDPARFSSDAMASVLRVGMGTPSCQQGDPAAPSGPQMPGNLVTYDPPHHTRLRALVSRAFTPRRVEGWREMVERVTASAIEAMSARAAEDGFDVIADLAAQVPVRVIAEILGIDPSRHQDFKRWTDTMSAAMTGSKRHMDPVESGAGEAGLKLAWHLRRVMAKRKAEPKDDIISILVRAHEGDALTPEEVLGFAGVLAFAGTETSTNLIGNAVRVLVENAPARERVLADPELVPQLLEETLRWDSPIQYLFRRTTEEVEIAGVRIPADAIVTVLTGSANRDESKWGPDAERFDLDRNTAGHLGFGVGVHYCLGAALARMEAECAIVRLLPLLARSRFAGHALEPIDSVQFRGVRRLRFELAEADTAGWTALPRRARFAEPAASRAAFLPRRGIPTVRGIRRRRPAREAQSGRAAPAPRVARVQRAARPRPND